jgi:putative membrane protein
LAAALLVAWDLLLDPAMSKVTSYWIWGDTGSYYGMPWSNLFGWAVTGLMLFVILNKLAPEPRTALRFAVSVYFVNFALPVGFFSVSCPSLLRRHGARHGSDCTTAMRHLPALLTPWQAAVT